MATPRGQYAVRVRSFWYDSDGKVIRVFRRLESEIPSGYPKLTVFRPTRPMAFSNEASLFTHGFAGPDCHLARAVGTALNYRSRPDNVIGHDRRPPGQHERRIPGSGHHHDLFSPATDMAAVADGR
jgi:hypothetical protein